MEERALAIAGAVEKEGRRREVEDTLEAQRAVHRFETRDPQAGGLLVLLGDFPLDADVQAGTIFDFANDADRLRLKIRLWPRPDMDLGICRLNSFSAGPLRGRYR